VGQQPLKDGHLRAMTMLPMPLQPSRMVAWSAIALGPIEVLTSDPTPSLVSNKADIYLGEVPEMPDGTLAQNQ